MYWGQFLLIMRPRSGKIWPGVLSCFLCFVMFLWRPCFKTHRNNNRHFANNQNLWKLFFRRSIGWSYCMLLFFPWGCPAMFGTLGFTPFPDISNESLTRRGCGLAEKALSLFWVQQDNAITSLVRVLRLVRIFRITRLLQRTKALRELSKLVSMMATCLKAMNIWTTFEQLLNITEHHWTSLTPEWSTGYTLTTFSHRMCSVFLHLLPRGNCFKPWGGIRVPWGTLFSDFFRHTRMEGMRLYIQELIQLPMSKPVETI